MVIFSKCDSISKRFSFRVKYFKVLVILGFLGYSGIALPAGERFGEQGNALAGAIDRELMRNGFCKDHRDCFDKFPLYGGHGDRVNFTLYGVSNQEKRRMLAAVVEFVIVRGMEVTQGVPIQIQAFPKPHTEYVNFKNFFSKKPMLRLEIEE